MRLQVRWWQRHSWPVTDDDIMACAFALLDAMTPTTKIYRKYPST